jgi:hypothetical protein
MTAQQSSVGTAPGIGSALEILRLGGTDVWVPSTVIRALDDSGDLASLRRDSDGGLRVHVQNAQTGKDVPYARDPADRMRVSVESSTTVPISGTAIGVYNYLTPGNPANQNGAGYYAAGGSQSMDIREQQQIATQQAFAMTRQRWVVT